MMIAQHDTANRVVNALVWFCIAALLLLTQCAEGQDVEWDVSTTFASEHYVERAGDASFNETNPGAVFVGEMRHTESVGGLFALGVMQNSFDQTSMVGGVGLAWHAHRWIHFESLVGMATGYGEMKTGILPTNTFGLVPTSVQAVQIGPPDRLQLTVYHVPGAFAVGGTVSL